MSESLSPERRQAIRARAESWRVYHPTAASGERGLVADVLDLLAALETAEAERGRPAETPQAGGREVRILYTNWRGETAERRIIPGSIWFGSTEWHRDEQYLLRAWDVEKEAVRDFALRDVREWREGADQP